MAAVHAAGVACGAVYLFCGGLGVFVEDFAQGEAGAVGVNDAQAVGAGVGVGRGDDAVGEIYRIEVN